MASETVLRGRFSRLSLALLAAAKLLACDGGGSADDAPRPAISQGHDLDIVEGVGFETPASVLHDEAADIYLVSNVNGAPLDHDGNGFISRLNPLGRLVPLRWIEGGKDGVELNAPKGMALLGDTLFVADSATAPGFSAFGTGAIYKIRSRVSPPSVPAMGSWTTDSIHRYFLHGHR